MLLKTIWLPFLMIVGSRVTEAQKVVSHSNQQWIQYYNQTRLSKRWLAGVDGGFRWKDGDKLLYIARLGVGYQINPNIRLSAGMASTGTYGTTGLTRVEFRPYQEVMANLAEKKVNVTQRFRLEERYFKRVVNGDFTDGHDFNFRFRYQISVSIPILKLSKADPNKKVSILLSDELFINAGESIVYNVFDRNRFVVGPSVQLSKSWTVAISYMHQFAQLNVPAAYDQDNVLWYTIRHNIDLTKSKDVKE